MMTFKQFLLQNKKDARKAPLGTTTSKKGAVGSANRTGDQKRQLNEHGAYLTSPARSTSASAWSRIFDRSQERSGGLPPKPPRGDRGDIDL